jgi:AbrB family looped-hinge helix DNA binding protein
MSKVTSKLQLTVPKVIADRYGIRPGDELEWMAAGESIRIELGRSPSTAVQQLTPEEKLELFDRGSERLNKLQKEKMKRAGTAETAVNGRGW